MTKQLEKFSDFSKGDNDFNLFESKQVIKDSVRDYRYS